MFSGVGAMFQQAVTESGQFGQQFAERLFAAAQAYEQADATFYVMTGNEGGSTPLAAMIDGFGFAVFGTNSQPSPLTKFLLTYGI
ncbi:hypothetical protein AWB91_08950 [Mycobacterium paraense]|uniref:PE domain-containing protein n=1 Tax=Mycobacterium paraense TaxID=767916 RepID=A0ABX3VS03_9MYCO|nr:hypothetical protein AWB91_08950 [Mycobacterium paraense]ORW34696.1 hypothetical protein AWB88_02830 [Mycobacterium paraense]